MKTKRLKSARCFSKRLMPAKNFRLRRSLLNSFVPIGEEINRKEEVRNGKVLPLSRCLIKKESEDDELVSVQYLECVSVWKNRMKLHSTRACSPRLQALGKKAML